MTCTWLPVFRKLRFILFTIKSILPVKWRSKKLNYLNLGIEGALPKLSKHNFHLNDLVHDRLTADSRQLFSHLYPHIWPSSDSIK
jgi:hypothetical protein